MKDTGGNSAILARAMKDLLEQWERTSGAWRDRARPEFERDYLETLRPRVVSASNAMQQIEEFVRQVQRECG